MAPDRTLNPDSQGRTDADELHINPEGETEVNPPEQVKISPDVAENLAEKVERERLEMLLQELQNKVEENPELQKFKDQILFEITQDGLRIQIMDADNRPMFNLGSAQLQPYFEDILLIMADTIKGCRTRSALAGIPMPNPLPVRVALVTGSCLRIVPMLPVVPWCLGVPGGTGSACRGVRLFGIV